MTALYHDERCFWHSAGEHVLILPLGPWLQPMAAGGHAESPESKRRLRNLVEVSGLMTHLDQRSAPPARRDDMLRIHPAAYIDRFKALSDAGGGEIGHEARFSPGGYEIAALSAGLAMQAVRDVWERRVPNAYVLSRPPGHHCLPDAGMGFCLLANIPVALEALRAAHGPLRAAVVDWDVHHGNGTEAIYLDRADTLTISLHQEACFPTDTGQASQRGHGAGLGTNLNVPLLPGGGHQAYLDAMDLLVLPALRAFRPEIIVIAYGTTARIAKGAIKRVRTDGVRAGMIRPITLWPFPKQVLNDLSSRIRTFVVFEMSTGQMLEDVQIAVAGKADIIFHGRPGGVVPTPIEFARIIYREYQKTAKGDR